MVELIKFGDREMITRTDVGILETAIAVAAQAKALCPVMTGNLRGSIGYIVGDRRTARLNGVPEEGEGWVGTAVEYAGYVEFGTKHQKAQPYLRPAGEIVGRRVSAEVVKAYQDQAGRALNGRR